MRRIWRRKFQAIDHQNPWRTKGPGPFFYAAVVAAVAFTSKYLVHGALCPLHISRSDAPIGLRCSRRQFGTKPSDVASAHHSHWPNGAQCVHSRRLVRGSRTILYDSLVGTVKESYLLQQRKIVRSVLSLRRSIWPYALQMKTRFVRGQDATVSPECTTCHHKANESSLRFESLIFTLFVEGLVEVLFGWLWRPPLVDQVSRIQELN